MSMRPFRWAVLAVLVAGCGEPLEPSPRIDSVSPAVLAPGAPVELEIRGADFLPSVHADYARASGSQVGSAFQATLGTVALEQVTWVDTSTVRGRLSTVLAPGTYDLTLRDPSGRQATLSGAVRILEPPAALVISSAPQIVTAGTCSAPVGVRLVAASGAAMKAAEALGLTAVASGGAGLFSDAACTAPLTTLLLAADHSDAVLYFRSTRAGSATLTVSSDGLTSALQEETVTPSAPAALEFGPMGTLVARGEDVPVTLRAVDAFGNETPGFAGPATLSSSPALPLTCVTGCDTGLVTASFTSGAWLGALRFDAGASGVTLRADAGALGGTSPSFSVVDGDVRTPPLARLTASPPVVRAGEPVTFDASGSSDRETTASALSVSWDFEGDQTGPAPWGTWSPSQQATHAYGSPGRRRARVAVQDADGDVAYAELDVLVLDVNADDCVVTDGSALDDGASSCADPNLSLPEAIRLSNALPRPQTITFTPGLEVDVSQTFTLTDDVNVIGPPGTVVNGASFEVVTGNALLSGLTLTSSGSALGTVEAGASLELSHVVAQGYAPLVVYGSLLARESAFESCHSVCIDVDDGALDFQVLGCRFDGSSSDNGINIHSCPASGGSREVVGSVFTGLSKGVAVKSDCGSGPVRIANNTFDGLLFGVDFGKSGGSGHTLANNIVVRSSTAAIRCNGVAFTERSHQLFYGNALDGCGSDPGDLIADPLFIDSSAGDYRLLLASPARDSGLDLGLDLTPASPGSFLGAAPDRGGRETW